MLNEDYKDLLLALSAEKVRYLLVGAYALAAHGYPRATMDIDVWVKPDADNAAAVLRALERFGAPLHDLSQQDLEDDETVFQIGVAPRRVDIMTGVSGLDFDAAFDNSVEVRIDDMALRIPSIADLIRNKRASGRTRDLADAEALEELQDSDPGGATEP